MTEDTVDHTNGGSGKRSSRRVVLIGGLLVVALVGVAAIAFANRSSNPNPSTLTDDRQVASTWARQNPEMWSWMQGHWDEMTAMHQHWRDVSWMQANLPDFTWMQGHWSQMSWMHDHWTDMMWMHDQDMMGASPGGMMGG